jgi:ribosomal protein S18 acetylase RimI-like enzyme
MKMKDLATIKDYHEFDAKELYAIVRHVHLTTNFMSDDFDRKYLDVTAFAKYHQELLYRAGSMMLIALSDNRPIGYLTIEANAASRQQHTARLTMGMVENYRKKGIGRQLLQAALERLENTKVIEILYLMVRADHVAAINLYESLGFKTLVRLSRDTKIGNEYYDGILMRRFIKEVPADLKN